MNRKSRSQWLSLFLMGVGLVLIIAGLVNFLNPASPPPTQAARVLAATEPVQTAAPSPTPLPPSATPVPPTPTLASSATPTVTPTLTFDGQKAYQYVLDQVAIGPRPTGTEAGWATGDYILAELKAAGWPVETQEFVFQGVKGRNIIARRGQGPIVILGAHYDTRPAADQDPDPSRRDQWIDGANDGASGVAVLLELARALEADKLDHEVWLAFFDAEDRGRLEEWPFSVGARQMAENLTVQPQSVVVVDMIGDADQNIYFEHNSDEALREQIWTVAAELGYQKYIIPQPKHTIIDDHLPFAERGIPAVDMIDFDYPYWHTMADTADKVAPASLERVGRTLEVWLEER